MVKVWIFSPVNKFDTETTFLVLPHMQKFFSTRLTKNRYRHLLIPVFISR